MKYNSKKKNLIEQVLVILRYINLIKAIDAVFYILVISIP